MIVDKACFERGCACYDDRVDGPGVEVVAREWQGLTDEEIEIVSGDYTEAEGFKHGAHWALEQLREKNA